MRVFDPSPPFFLKSLSLSLSILALSSFSPPHISCQSFTIFHSNPSPIHLFHHRHFSWFYLDAHSLSSLFRERNESRRRLISSIKFLPSFATQGNFLSSNFLLIHAYRRIFLIVEFNVEDWEPRVPNWGFWCLEVCMSKSLWVDANLWLVNVDYDVRYHKRPPHGSMATTY